MANEISMERVQAALPALDISAAMPYCGDSEEIFLSVLEEYVKNAPLDRLEEDYAREDWEDYRIAVHSLKSASLVVGLAELSAQAKAMNEAAKAQDLAYIRQNHRALLEHILNTVSALKPLFESQ